MNNKDLLKLAKQHFIFDASLSKVEVIRLIQISDGEVFCFATDGGGECTKSECIWREDCRIESTGGGGKAAAPANPGSDLPAPISILEDVLADGVQRKSSDKRNSVQCRKLEGQADAANRGSTVLTKFGVRRAMVLDIGCPSSQSRLPGQIDFQLKRSTRWR